MKIRTQYILNAFVFGIILLLVSASVLIADQRAWEIQEQEVLTTQLEQEAYELGYLTNDYLLYGESQQARRWESKFASFSQDLSNLKVSTPEQQALLNNIKSNQQRLKAVFAEVRAMLERELPGQGAVVDPAFMQTSWSRLEVQYQGIIFDASRLTRVLSEQEDQLGRVTGLLSFVLIAAFGAFLLVNYGLTFRRVLKAIADLQVGAKIIGSGNLDFAIAVRHADEIGELSRAFNRMTCDLKHVTASKAELEREIAERKQAEEAVQEAKEHLEIRVKERTAELEQANRALQQEIADRKRAEETVQAERQRLYDVLETLPAYAVLLSADYHVPFANRFFRERFDESHGRCCFEYLFGRSQPCEICEPYTVMKTNAPHRWEWIGPDGRNYDVYDFPFTDADGSHLIMEMGLDITERKQAEAELLRYQGHLEELVKERTAELESRNVQLAARTAELQVANESLRAARLAALNLMEDARAAQRQVELVNAQLLEQAEELEVAGEELAAQNDELRAAQQMLEAERRRYQELFDFAPGGYLVTDLHGTIREANRAAAEMLGVDAEWLEGKPLTVYVDQPEHSGLYARLAGLQQVQVAQTWEMHLTPRQGESFPALVDVAPARDAQGQLVGLRWLLRDITERKRAEEEIANLAKFPAENPNPVLRVSPEGVLQYANAASDALLREWGCAAGGHVPEFWRHLVATTFTSQSETTIEVECQQRVYSFVVVPIVEAGYVNLYGRDITVRKQAEEALHESEEKLRTLFELLPVGVSALDAEHKIAYANPALEKIVRTTREGLRRGGYKTRTYLRSGGTSMPAEEFASSRAIREQSAVHNVETGIVLEGGNVIWTNVSAVPVAFSDWKVVIVTTDITERKRAEQALKESEEWHRLALDAAALGTWRHDLATGIIHLDERGKFNYGFDSDTVSLAQVLARVHPDDVARVEQEIGAALNPETSTGKYATECRALYPDGSVRWLSVHLRTHFAGQGAERKPVTALGTCQDITARKKREEELHRLNRILRARSHSDQALMRVTTESEYIQEVCKIIVEDCGHAMVWVGFAEEDEGKAIRPVAYAGFEEGYLETLHITWADTERGRGPTGTAVRTGKPSFCRNMHTDPQFTPWRAEALKRGYASSLVLPLLDNDRAFGALTIYFREPDPFTDDEVELLAGLANDLAYGIRTIRLRIAHARAEEALHQSEERFSKAFYNSPVGITLTRLADGSFTDVNQTFLKMTGLQHEDVIGHNSAELNLAPDVEYSGALLKHVRETGSFRDAEFQVRVKDGELRHWLVNAQTLTLGADEFILGMLVDITQRKQAEEGLRRAKEELELRVQERTAELERANAYNRSLIEASLDPLVTIGPDGKITDVNAATELVTAYSRQELIGTDFSDYFTKPERARAVYQRVFDEGSVRNFELELVHRDGHLTSVLYNASVYRDEAGQVVGVFAAARDITKRKLAEEQLRLQSAALEAAANGIIITDVQGNIQWANPAFAQMTGYARGEVIGQNPRFLKSGVLARQDYEQLWETILSGQVWRGQLVNRRQDGSLYSEEQTIAPVLNAEAEITHFVAIKQDITDRKRAEAQLERNNEELRALSQAERSQRLLAETLSAANLALTQTLDLTTVMETLLDYVGRLVPYDSANVMLLEAESHLSVRVTRGYERWADADQTRAISFDVQANPILQELFTTRKSILVPDTRTHPSWEIRPGAEHVQSWLGVPLMAGGNVIGVYSLDKMEPAFFTQEHVRRAEMLVGQAAVAIQNAWLFEQVRAGRERLQSLSRRLVEVQEAERHYVARELHDEVGQALTSLKFSLGQLGAETDPAQHAARIAELKHMTDEILESLHRLAMNLRPASLDHLGLVSALNQYVRAIGDRYGLIAQFKAVDMGERLPPAVETALYRIVQEALTNIVRHARATRADVLLERRGDQVIVVVEDNGLGFEPQGAHPAQGGHLGLVGMQERAEMLGGSLVIESTVGVGTTVAVEVPNVYSYPHRG